MLTMEMMEALNDAENWPERSLADAQNGDKLWGVKWTAGRYWGIWYGSIFIVASGAVSEMIADEFSGRRVDRDLARDLHRFLVDLKTH